MKKLNLREWIFLGIAGAAVIFAFASRQQNQSLISKNAGAADAPSEASSQKTQEAASASQRADKKAAEKSPGKSAKEAMTPDRARELFEKAASIADIQQQARVYRETTRALCKAGYVKEAWEMMLKEPGFSRDSQLTAFFLTAPLDLKACAEKIATLQDNSEKKVALQYYLAKSFDQYPGILEAPDFKRITDGLTEADPGALADILATAVRSRFDSSKDKAEREKLNQIVLDLHAKKLISNDDFANMLTRNIGKNPSELWSWVAGSSVGLDNPESYPGQMRKGIVETMVTGNPPEALAKLATASGEGAAYDLRLGLTTWAKSSPAAANEWYAAQRPQMPQALQDSAAEAFAALALGYREMEGAETWANQISNVELRNAVLKKIHPEPPQKP